MSLPSQTESGLAVAGRSSVDVAERDELRREVRHLHADRLLAGDRGEDADLRRRERVGEVVLERRDLRHLRPRRELELVAGHARAGDLAHDGRVDAELRERAHEQVGDLRARVAASSRRPPATLRSRARSGSRYSACSADVSKRPRCSRGRARLLGHERAAPPSEARPDDVRVRLRAVEQRLRPAARRNRRRPAAAARLDVLGRLRLARGPLERAPRARSGRAASTWPVRRRIAPVEAPVTSSAPAEQERAADDRRAGRRR